MVSYLHVCSVCCTLFLVENFKYIVIPSSVTKGSPAEQQSGQCLFWWSAKATVVVVAADCMAVIGTVGAGTAWGTM